MGGVRPAGRDHQLSIARVKTYRSWTLGSRHVATEYVRVRFRRRADKDPERTSEMDINAGLLSQLSRGGSVAGAMGRPGDEWPRR